MDMVNQLSLGEKLVAGGGVLMLIASLLPWYKVTVASGIPGYAASGSTSGWGAPGSIWSLLAILLSIAMAGIVGATKFANVQMPALPQGVTWGRVWGGGAAAIVVLMLLKAWRLMSVDIPPGLGISDGFGFGFFIGIVATAAIAYGGYLLYSADRGGGAIRT